MLRKNVKAKKLKIYIKSKDFSYPIPALRFRTIRWISKLIIRCYQLKFGNQQLKSPHVYENILKNLTSKDIDGIIDELEKNEPFELVDIEDYDENGQVIVRILYFIKKGKKGFYYET